MHRGALAGFGAVAENGHCPALLDQKDCLEIVAVAEQSQQRRAAAARCFPEARIYESLAELLAAEKHLDFADIATPPACHFGAAEACLEAGLHVLCEKPLVFSRREFDLLLKAAEKKRLALFTVHNWKYAPPMLKARELIQKGMIGAVLHAELHVLRNQPSVTADGRDWRQDPKLSGGGIMADHGWHNFYLAHCLTGGKPLSVTAAFTGAGREKAERSCSCQIEFEGADPQERKTALVYLTWESPVRKNWGAVYGRTGIIEIRDDIVILERKGEKTVMFETGEKLSAGSAHPTWMAGLLGEFKTALESPAQRLANLREAETCVALMTAGYESALTGGTVQTGLLRTFAQHFI
ncbi:MAG: Gfo/Idh/MocA family oxidoreductase [Elusimicrobiaceae bacterium]|nr:Gfo/Idh/MocA family oxidoreductase [Elusimicrobiaceae bacterium]